MTNATANPSSLKRGSIVRFHTPLRHEDPTQLYVIQDDPATAITHATTLGIDYVHVMVMALGTGFAIPPRSNVNLSDLVEVLYPEIIAIHFCRGLRQSLTPEQFAEMQKLNGTAEYPLNGACPSGDYGAANVIMDQAFRDAFGHRATDIDGAGSPLSDATMELWNAAWSLARRRNYAVFKK